MLVQQLHPISATSFVNNCHIHKKRIHPHASHWHCRHVWSIRFINVLWFILQMLYVIPTPLKHSIDPWLLFNNSSIWLRLVVHMKCFPCSVPFNSPRYSLLQCPHHHHHKQRLVIRFHSNHSNNLLSIPMTCMLILAQHHHQQHNIHTCLIGLVQLRLLLLQ